MHLTFQQLIFSISNNYHRASCVISWVISSQIQRVHYDFNSNIEEPNMSLASISRLRARINYLVHIISLKHEVILFWFKSYTLVNNNTFRRCVNTHKFLRKSKHSFRNSEIAHQRTKNFKV